jgi:hypothetical protein
MADYYPLIAKAVSGLEKSTGEARRALYDRARTALLAQLRGVEPALSEPDITRERLALEEAIRKVEAEAARRSRSDPPPAGPGARQEPRQELRPELRPEGRPAGPPSEVVDPPPRNDLRTARQTIATPADDGDDQSDLEETRQALPLSPASVKPVVEPRQAEEPRTRAPREPAVGAEAHRMERPPWSAGGGPSLSDNGLRGLRDVIVETETLGGGTAEAAKNARAYQAATNTDFERSEPRPDSPTEARGEPRIESELARPLLRRSSPYEAQKMAGREPPPPEPSRGIEARDSSHGRGTELPRFTSRPHEPSFGQETDELPAQDAWSEFEAEVRSEYATRQPSSVMRQEDVRGRVPSPPRAIKAERVSERKSAHLAAWSASRTSNKIVAMAVMALLVLAIGAVAYWWGRDFVAAIRGTPGANSAAGQVTPAESGTRGKIVERAPTAPSSSEGALVAQKVVLYEEDQSNLNGTQFVGSAVWRTERVAPGAGQKPDVVVRAEIEIPERKVSIRWSLRRNDDNQAPTSHTIEIMFTLPPDFPHGSISNIPGVLMKQGETARGIPLSGVGVKVTANVFLIGLISSVEADVQRNVQLLKERPWFDIPVVYGDGKRAIIAIEKGTPGERAFTEAFAAWGQ